MRRIMWFALGFGASCGLCIYLLPGGWILPTILLSGLVCLLCVFFYKRFPRVREAGMIVLGICVGLLWFSVFQGRYLSRVSGLDGTEQLVSFVAGDYSVDVGYASTLEAVLLHDDRPYRIKVYLPEDCYAAPGDVITGSFRLRVPTVTEGYASGYYSGNGIFLLAYAGDSVQIVPQEQLPVWCLPAVLRFEIREILEQALPPDILPFCKALLLGDSSGLDYGTDTALKISGIRHIIAVSGLHISMLYSLVSVVTMRKRYLTVMIGLPVLVMFAAVTGCTPSVVRACTMVALMMLSGIFQREYDPPTALAFAALIMLLINPAAIASVSFQLSVGCVAGILLFYGRLSSWFGERLPKRKGLGGKLIRWFSGSVSVTLSAMSLTTPLSAWYFGTVSLMSVLTNLLTLWVVTLIFNALVMLCLLWLIFPGAAIFLGRILSVPVGYVLLTARIFASFPLAAVYTVSPYITAWLIVCYLLLGIFLLLKNPRVTELVCCMILSLCMALVCSWLEPLTDDTRITMLDVGQGQSILLQSDGYTFLVDCGGDSDSAVADTVAQTLLSQGIGKLDGLILTHYDRDHSGALRNLLTRVETEVLILPETVGLESYLDMDTTVLSVSEELVISFGNGAITVYGPVFGGESNENSLCVLFDSEKCDILITGDRSEFGERMLMRNNTLADVDILVAGHHGAKDSTSPELLRMVQPEIVMISVGEGNFYEHPHPDLLRRLREFGCTVYRTDISGTIVIRR